MTIRYSTTKWSLLGYSKIFNTLFKSYIFTARVAKRAKVMSLQVFVILSPMGGGGGYTECNMGPVLHQMQHGTRSEHLRPPWDLATPPPLGLGHFTRTPPPGTWSLHPAPPIWDLVTPPRPAPPGTWSLHPTLGLGHSTPPPHLGLGHSTPPPSPT